MNTSTAIDFDMGAMSTKTGVVKASGIVLRGWVIEMQQDRHDEDSEHLSVSDRSIRDDVLLELRSDSIELLACAPSRHE